MVSSLTPTGKILAVAFGTSGVIHLVRPKTFARSMPRQVPHPIEVIKVSGVAELACAVGLLVPRTRRVAGPASAALLVGIFPANVQMTVDAARAVSKRGVNAQRTAYFAGTAARLPLQWPLIRAAWRAGR
ncbi:membrane protein [Flexivirga endophytica]|uniref:Membrane protein n=1 Tax=Flexivirga endophytica TaxID=1849103 RepID=A0A916TDQ9_9MICO|nr:DoxX family protein [Flexivirga endophytica]GGB40123.1 membrane protein [Flexivirga endophytica]GHB47991.1 membrane protein [Flexivirga endophytica]